MAIHSCTVTGHDHDPDRMPMACGAYHDIGWVCEVHTGHSFGNPVWDDRACGCAVIPNKLRERLQVAFDIGGSRARADR
jgi:hypothetical protein